MKARKNLRRLTRRFGLLVLLTLIGAGAGAAYGALRTPTYTAKAYVVAIGGPGDSVAALNFAQAYGRVATSGPVLAQAATLLGPDRSGLSGVTASTSPDAPLIEITATGPSAAHAADVANSTARALADYGSLRKAETHVGLAVLAGATTPQRPSSPRPPMELLVGAAGGLLIGGLAMLAGVGRRAGESGVAELASWTAEVPRPGLAPPGVDRATGMDGYLGVWRAPGDAPAIGAYRSTASSVPDEDVEAAPVAAATPTGTTPTGASPTGASPTGTTPTGTTPTGATPTGATPAAATPAGAVQGGAVQGRVVQGRASGVANGVVYARPIVGRATVAGMDEEEDD